MSQLAADESSMAELEKELPKTEKILKNLELVSFLSGEYDDKNALVSIHAGQGGTEAMDWTNMILRMYTRFCERRGWQTEILDYTAGEEAGVKSVTFKVIGHYAYGYLKGEAGTHRLVRQSPFNADKLRQTSFALTEVMPELEDVDLPDIQIKDDDLDWQFIHSGGHGGQNVNKVATAVRLTHIPSGIVVTAQSERFQEQNRKIALNLLRGKLWLLEKEVAKGLKKEIKGDYRPASWGTQIRSYVLHPYKMVKDLRTQVETGNTDAVLDGEIDEFIDAELKMVVY
jgi:peptide chain release factor 2